MSDGTTPYFGIRIPDNLKPRSRDDGIVSRELVVRDDGRTFIITRVGRLYSLSEVLEERYVGDYQHKYKAHRAATGADPEDLHRLDEDPS